MSSNVCILVGNLARDVDLQYAASGSAFLRGTIVTNSYYDGEEKPSYVPFIVFGKTAENFAEICGTKGSLVCVEGMIQSGSYINSDGVKIYTLDVKVHKFTAMTQKPSIQQNKGKYTKK